MPSIIALVPGIDHYDFDSTLGETTFTFVVRWNEEDKAWYLDMLEADKTPILIGAKIVLGTYIGRRSTHPFFAGNIIGAVDTGSSNLDATFDDIGTRIELWHFTTDELVNAALAGD